MQDEILGKALITDAAAVPRYRIVAEDGTVLAENATIALMNPVEQEGTPVNTATLLSNETAQKFKSTVPATVNEAISMLAEGQGVAFAGQIVASAWSSKEAAITIPYDTGTRDTDALVMIIPQVTTDNINTWKASGIKCYKNQGTVLTFKCTSQPTSTVYFIGIIFAL